MGMLTPVALTRSGSRTPIFAIHNGTGSAFPFVALAHELGPDQPFYVFQQLDFTQDSDFAQAQLPPQSVEAMASVYIEALRALRPAGPYVLAGMCSTGAYIAYEMAQQACALNLDVDLLILFDPAYSEVSKKACSQSRLLIQQAQEIARRVKLIPGTDAEISVLQAQLAELFSELGLKQGLLHLSAHYLDYFLELFASNHQASLSYVPKPYAGRTEIFVPALSFGDDRLIPSAGWKTLIPMAEVHVLPIDRENLYSDAETVAYVAASLRADLH
jgi:thioesterase domain-containing protein